MARKIIDIGTVGNDGTGDSIRDSFNKVNDNFLELYSSLGLGDRLKFTGLSDVPTSYIGQEGAVLTVNQTTTGLKFKQITPGVGITIDSTTNPNEIKLNAVFSQISADKAPQLGGDLSATSGGINYRIKDLSTPIFVNEAANKGYVDTKLSRAGVFTVDPATGTTNSAAGRMTGPLILSRNPEPEDDTVYDGLIAATKSYVDNAAFGSVANLYVATSGQDARVGVSDELQGRALAYAYRTVEAALRRAEELILESRVEIGPYKKTLTYGGGTGICTLSNIGVSNESGTGFSASALMSIDNVELSSPGANYQINDIITISGGTIATNGQAATIKVLSTTASPGAIVTFAVVSTGVYSAIPGNLAVSTTSNSAFGSGAKFDLSYKVNNVKINNPGTGYGLVSVRITGGGGSGAFGIANVIGGTINSISITDPGSGFTSVPTVVANLPTFAIYTAGLKTDFTGNYASNTLTAAATRDIRPGLYLRGETSGALAQILTHTGDTDNQGNELFDVDIVYGNFVIGEAISYGDVTKNTQVSVFIESGIYEENLPLKVPQNVAIIGDEFRRVIIKPRKGPSSSPWAFQNFRRDLTVDGITTATTLFANHYLTDPSQPVYPVVVNAGKYKAASELLYLNKLFIQEELIGWIDYQISHDIEPFDGQFSFNSAKCSRDVGLIIDAVMADIVLGSTYLSTAAGIAYLRSYSSVVTTLQKAQTVAGINKARDLILTTIYGSSTYVSSSTKVLALFDIVTDIIQSVSYPTATLTYANPSSITSDGIAAKGVLIANRSFIKDEVIGYLADSGIAAGITGWDSVKFSRHIGYLVDAVVFDLVYGGNSQSVLYGQSFYDASGNIAFVWERNAFNSALTQLKVIIPEVISNSTSWTNKSSSNTTSQVINLTAASSSGASATKLNSLFDTVKDIVANGVNAPASVSPVVPTYTDGVNAPLNTDRLTVIAAKTTIQAQTIAFLNAEYNPGTFTYNSKLCKRDAGLIVDALVFDLRYGGFNRTVSAALKYFQGVTQYGNSLIAITTQLEETVASMLKIASLARSVIQNQSAALSGPFSGYYQEAVAQTIDQAYIFEVGTPAIITSLINAVIDIISGSTSLNLPKDNNKLDVFLCNDAVMIRKVSCQGQGGFMMVLDPQGQILAKSPYCQESASFIGSTGRKQFAGGMFVDGFAGNLEFRMSSAASTTKISITGLDRFPNLPASVIISDSVYRLNYVRDFVYGPAGTFVYDQTKCSRDVGLIVNAVLDDLIFGTNYRAITAGESYLRSYSSVVENQQKVQTIAGINKAKEYVLALITDPTEQAAITTSMGIVTTIINSGTAGSAPALSYTSSLNTASGIINGAREVIANRDFIIDEIISYINANLSPETITDYNETTRRSDIGDIVDALAFDIMYGGNSATQVIAKSYYYGTTNILGSQAGSYVSSYTRLKNIIGFVVQATTGWTKNTSQIQSTSAGAGSSTAATTAGNLIQIIIDVINSGVAAAPSVVNPTYINGANYVAYSTDKATILAGLSTVQSNVIKFLNSTYGAGGSSATIVLDPSTPYIFDVGPQNCTISNASPAVITKANHNLQAGATLVFSSTGSLPSGLVAGQRYYVLLDGLGANFFRVTDTLGSITPVSTTSAGSGTHIYDRIYEILMPGNRSMLSNDFTQIADLGYGVIATNGGLTEAVSMFTYYCQISYYSINGGQIRSIAGSSAHGRFALVAEGSDPLEVPTPTDLYYNLSQAVTCYYPTGTYSNSAQGVIIYVNNYSYVPLPNSELEVDHGSGVLFRYPVNSAYTGSDLPAGVARLTLGSSTGATGLSGLYASVADGVIMTIRQSQSLMLSGNLSGVSVRPSTGLVFTESATNVYRVLQFTDYVDPAGPYTCTISTASPAVITKSNHGLLVNYPIIFSTTGALPTGLTAGQTYYVLGTNLTQNTFTVSSLKGGGAIATTANGSGTHTYIPQGITTTLLRENYSYIYLTVYQPNDYSAIATTATATATTTASMTSSSISGTTLTVGTLASGTILPGMVLTGGSIISGTYIVSNIPGVITGTTTYSSLTGTSVTAAATYTGVSQLSTSGSGTGATFTVVKTTSGTSYNGVTTITVVSGGTGYTVGDTITISGAVLGGVVTTNDLTFTLATSVNSTTYWTVSASQTQTSTTITGTSNQFTVGTSTGGVVNQPIKFGISTQATTSDGPTAYITVGTTDGMIVDMPLAFTVTSGSAFGGLVSGTTYYVKSIISGTQITLSATQGGSTLSVTSGSGSMTVVTGGTLPGGVTSGATYYISSVPSSTKVTISPYQRVDSTTTATTVTSATLPGCTIVGTTLTVGSGVTGTITAGMLLSGSGVTAGTYIISGISGVGDGSTWLISTSQTVSSPTSITGTGYNVNIGSTTGVQRGQPITFTGTGFGNLVSGTEYYIAAIPTATTVVVSATAAMTAVFVVTGATGTLATVAKFKQYAVSTTSGSVSTIISGGITATVTANSGAGIFTTPYAHGFTAGDVIKVSSSGTLATGLVTNAHYFVIATNLTSTTFSVSLAPAGTAVLTSGTPTGTMYVGKVQGRAGDKFVAVVALGPYDRARAVGSVFNFKGVDYIITRYDPETVTNTAFGRVYVQRINLTTGVQSDTGFADSVVSYVSAVTMKASVRRGSSNANGTLTIRIALTRVTGHDLLDIGTGSYADTNYPNEIYGPAVNARNPAGETVERSVGRVFYVTTDQYGNFRVGPYFSVDQGTGKVSFSAAIALSNLDGLGFKRGVPISEFSTDSSFANNATDTVPTQNATRIYLERRLGLTHTGAAVDNGQLIPINTGGFLALNGSLKMKGNADFNNNKIINLSNPTDPQDAVNLRSLTLGNITGFTFTNTANSQLATFNSSGNVINSTMAGDATVVLSGSTLTITVSAGAIVNSKVSASAAIDQSKLAMTAAGTRTNATGITQAERGLASFDDTQFTVTNGWVTVKDNGIPLSKIAQVGAYSVVANNSNSTANVTSVAYSSVVDIGAGIKKSQYGATGFLRRTNSSVSGGTLDADYGIVDMSANADANKLVVRDSNGDFSARIVNLEQIKIDSNIAVDTSTAGSGGYVRFYGWNTVGGVLIQSGSNAGDNKTLYWNDTHQFKTKDGSADAPITASSIQVTAITTGGNTSTGTITGRWTLTGTSPNESRLQSTYSADLAEYYEGDKEYEVGTVLVYGGDKEVTIEGKYGNTRVAGVVSNTAAFAMYDACPGFKNLVALQGRVPVKVVGKIQKGDLLVTSKIPGVAVSAGEDARTGTVIGKALETYDSDHIGTIEVAVGRS